MKAQQSRQESQMKKSMPLALFLCGVPCLAQNTYDYAQPMAATIFANNRYTVNTTTSTDYPYLDYAPPVFLVCYNSTTNKYAACPAASSGSGTVTSGSQYSPAYYTGNGTTIGGVTPFNGLAKFSTTGPPTPAMAGTDYGLGNTTSSALVTGNLPAVTGANALGDSGVPLSTAGLDKGYAVDSGTANNVVISLPGTTYNGSLYQGGQVGAHFKVKFSNNSTNSSLNMAVNGGTGRYLRVQGYGVINAVTSGATFECFDDGSGFTCSAVSGRTMLPDANFYIFNGPTPTKLAQFDVSGVTALATRSLKVPDFSGTLALTDSTGKVLSTTNASVVGTSASPSVVAAGSAAAGAFSCATTASGATCTINDTAVTVNSQIHVWLVADENTRLGVTCNTAPSAVPNILLASKTAGTGFTINMPTITTNPACFDFEVLN